MNLSKGLVRLLQDKLILSLFLGLIIIGSGAGVIYHRQAEASSIFDSTYEADCRAGMKLPVSTTKIPALLKATYGKDYPGLQTVSDYSVDLDTYADSWKQLPNGSQMLSDYKAKLPTIISLIRTMYGEPFQKHRIVVVVVPNFATDYQYNEWNTTNVGGQYRPDLNLIMYSSRVATDPVLFIHEIIHSFNQGTIAADAYEEGLVESAAIRVAQLAQYSIGMQHAVNTDNRPDLSVLMGFFRTNFDSNVVNNRYDSAASIFGSLYDQDHNFYKTFRENLKNSAYFNEIIPDNKKFIAERLIGASLCGDLMFKPQYNVLRPYAADLQYVLYKSLPTTVRGTLFASDPMLRTLSMQNSAIVPSDVKLHLFQNVTAAQSLNIYPENKLYNDLAYDPLLDKLTIYSSYKRNDLLEIFYQYFKKFNHRDENKVDTVTIDEIKNFSNTISTSSASVLQEFTQLLETAPDQIKIDVQPKIATTQRTPGLVTNATTYFSGTVTQPCIPTFDAQSGPKCSDPSTSSPIVSNTSSSNVAKTYSSSDVLIATKQPANFSGEMTITVDSYKKVWVVTPKRDSAGDFWPASQVVWPGGFTATPKNIYSITAAIVTFQNGKIVTVVPTKPTASSSYVEKTPPVAAPKALKPGQAPNKSIRRK